MTLVQRAPVSKEEEKVTISLRTGCAQQDNLRAGDYHHLASRGNMPPIKKRGQVQTLGLMPNLLFILLLRDPSDDLIFIEDELAKGGESEVRETLRY